MCKTKFPILYYKLISFPHYLLPTGSSFPIFYYKRISLFPDCHMKIHKEQVEKRDRIAYCGAVTVEDHSTKERLFWITQTTADYN